MSITALVLRSYYNSVSTLQDYISHILDTSGNLTLVRDSDPQAYKDLLQYSYVASSLPLSQHESPRYKPYPPLTYMNEIIDKAQEKIFKKSKGRKPANILAAGYKLSSRTEEKGKANGGRLSITNYFVNTLVTALQAPEWERLLKRVGDDAMFHLLTEMSIFVTLPNDCLCQVTGQPLLYKPVPQSWIVPSKFNAPITETCRKRRPTNLHPEQRFVKRRRLNVAKDVLSYRQAQDVTRDPTCERTPADISFVRVRMFYSRPKFIPRSSNIIIGLPPNHVLNRIAPSYTRLQKYTQAHSALSNPRKRADDSRHLAKYVFPRQYGLSNAFSCTSTNRYQPALTPNFSNRESEIKLRGCLKTPKRVKPVLNLLEQTIWRHVTCRYKILCDAVCPSKVSTGRSTAMDSSMILELMSEHSLQPMSQASRVNKSVSMDVSDLSMVKRAVSQARKGARQKPKFAEFCCSHIEVYRYVILVTKAVIPHAFWGSQKNFKKIARYVKEFICCRRYESLTLHHVMQGFSICDCDWLSPEGVRQPRVSVSDDLKRRELLGEFLYWYFDSFLAPLLKTTFYITESSAFRNQILYFRHDDWQTLCEPLVDRLASETFEKMEEREAEEVLRQRRLGFSFVRLLPKETGVRPIVNLRRKAPQKGSSTRDQSINQILQATFQILTYEKEAQLSLLGSSVFGPNEIYTRLKDFKMRFETASPSNTLPKLYFVKLDVQACFDTIDQARLLTILRRIISEDVYMIQRYGQISLAAGKVKRSFIRKALPEDDHPHFLSVAQRLASALRSAIFVDQVEYTFAEKDDIIKLLEEHITENIVKIGSDYYRQVVGIPQGSVLSALLCSFFYGDLEQRKLRFSNDPESVLLRLIDDYLFITTDLSKAKTFLQVMSEGHPEYGCFISQDKTLVNFDHGSHVLNVVDASQRAFPWCGYLIDMKDLSVSVDYTRYHETYLKDSLTVENARKPGIAFVQKMMQLAKHKSHIIYCDAELNSERILYLNIYQNFLVAAMKMHHYISTLAIDVRRKAKFLLSTIKQMFQFTYATIRNRASSKIAKANKGTCTTQKKTVIFLGTHAFHLILSRKPGAYSSLIKPLAFDLSLPRNRRLRSLYRVVLADGQTTLAQLRF